MVFHSYSNYAKYAWGANEHRPISKTGHSANIFGSSPLGISIIDSIDTIYLADLKEFYQKSRDWIETKFNPNVPSEVSVFEINIRLVGGFLSIYALTNDKLYLDKAELMANRLLPAFDTPTGIPHALITLSNGASKNWNWAAGGCSILSEFGTVHLEFQYLSQLTGKDIYLQKVEKIRKVLKGASENNMYYNYLNPQTGAWCQKHASLGALGDSFYEYLLKSWILSGKKDEEARSMYENAMKAAEEAMLRKTPTSNLMYFGEQRSGRLDPQMGHLTCFVGGLYVLSASSGAISLNSSAKNQMEIAQAIGKTCRESYTRTATGLGPEAFHFERTDVEAKALRDQEKYYILRPEVIETWFYLWRNTHEQIYRDWAWQAIISLEKYCRVEGGYSGIRDVYSSVVSHDDVQQNIPKTTQQTLYVPLKHRFFDLIPKEVMQIIVAIKHFSEGVVPPQFAQFCRRPLVARLIRSLVNALNEQKDQHIHLLFDAIYKQLTEKNNLTADILLYTGDSTIRRTNSIQLLRIGKKVVVGVTDGIMIENKVLAKASEPVINFMSNFWSSFDSMRPNINAYRESIGNVCSSSTIMADLNCIILADERQQDAFQVDKQRQENGLSQLAVHIVPMISADKDNQDQDKKLSLISFRQQVLNILLKSRLQSVESNLPCIINGVSIEGSINARRIENLGAGISKCDKLGHKTYKIDTDAYKKINEKFGKDIINSIDREIDRKFVDKKVFQSSDELKILTDIFWNLVLHLMQRIVEYLFKEAQRTIVLDAILLLEATKIIVPMKHGYCIYDYQKSYSMYCRIL
ncbi:unnamed protein product [Rotaria socialis]|uniref:alpha-1,2-Mannosidase n=1 Tax=Rotaria socialis TaxID=392032 RepID=A0A820KJH1_9BILA|nr:unnamed protein product [Rotaria socialis]